jgi:phospholipid/cholesterol/gamma-HCH transport system substrate-binding protein
VKGRTALQIRRYGRSFLIMIAVMIIGTACGFYILLQQRLPNPFQNFYSVNAAFPSAAAVVPGLGEPVNVAGVHVGEITSTDLRNGHGIIHMDINPGKMQRLYRNASANLVPNTPLNDMQVNILPGTPSAGVLPHGATIPVGEANSPISADDLLDSLDTDTRTWLQSLITELDNGTRGRGSDLRALLMNLAPTARQLHQIGTLLVQRRGELTELVHNLGTVSQAAAAKDGQIRTVVAAGNRTVQAIAGQDAALRSSIAQLPGTLATTRSTLASLTGFSQELAPTATALLPTARKLPRTLRDASTLIRGAAVLPIPQIPKFEAAVLPLASQLGPIAKGLSEAIPPLENSFRVLNYATNELAYNPGGRNPGFLYWLSWFVHNADSFLSTSDANGPVWRTLLLVNCTTLTTTPEGKLLGSLLQLGGPSSGCQNP